MYLPIPPDTGGQHITSFSSSLKGQVETDENGHRLLVAMLHPGGSRRVHWHVEITGTFLARQLEDGPPSASDPVAGTGTGAWLDLERVDQLAGLRLSGLARQRGSPPALRRSGGRLRPARLRLFSRAWPLCLSAGERVELRGVRAAAAHRLRRLLARLRRRVPGKSHSRAAAGGPMLQGAARGRLGRADRRAASARDRRILRSADRLDSRGHFVDVPATPAASAT